jgi:alkanesulfonate monooxygenase SsuD/methylene tetrahydromethanopterin reductase-like flavin-dependent oxidoreductase (luciferase family)
MQFGFIVTTGDPRTVADLAAEAEVAGWDGVFYYDAIAIGDAPLYDPWVVMTAMAMRTERVRLGAIVTPPARRRPWKLAREAMTLDRLSNGRLILPVGLGTLDDAGFANVGEPTDARIRAEKLDESLAILAGLWTGEPFAFEGRHYRFGPMTFRPTPVQRPRVPIWVVGAWPHERSMRRAVRWDGIYVQAQAADGKPASGPEPVRDVLAYVHRERPVEMREQPFDVVVEGTTPPDDPVTGATVARAHADAGATWWIEADWAKNSVDAMRARIAAGPPRRPDEPHKTAQNPT